MAKIACFESVSQQLTPYLTLFQTDIPMTPFICDQLEKVIRQMLKRFVKAEVLREAKTILKLQSIDVDKTENCVTYKKVDIGFKAEAEINKVSSRVSDREIMDLRMSFMKFLAKTTKHLMDKTPVAFSVARALRCFNPKLMMEDSKTCSTRFRTILTKLAQAKRVDIGDCDNLQHQFDDFIDKMKQNSETKHLFQAYNIVNLNSENFVRLDVFLHGYMGETDEYSKLWHFTKSLLILSHGQANVEKGFSVNKEILVDNMGELTIVSKRLILDYITYLGGFKDFTVSAGLLKSAQFARIKYREYLDKKRKETLETGKGLKRKEMEDKISELRNKKAKLQQDALTLEKSAIDLADKAERNHSIKLISESNALRRAAETKKGQAKDCESDMEEITKQLKL